jgi:hypothetical protein
MLRLTPCFPSLLRRSDMADWAVIEITTGAVREVSLAQAAEITRLGKDEILWAIQEEGRCDTEAYIVVDVADVTEVMAALS